MGTTRDLFGIAAVLALLLAVAVSPPVAAYDTPPWDTGHQGFDPDPGDDEKDNPTPDDEQCPLGNPVNAATGDNIELYTDFDIPGPGPKLGLTRTYHCQDRINGPFGRGWHSNLTTSALAVTDGDQTYAIVRQGDGKRKRFTRNPDGTFEAAAGTYQTLVLNPDGSITLTGRHGDVEEFDADGRLTERRDRYGNALQFTHDSTGFLTSIADDAGRTLSFTKGADGRVATATDPLGRTYSYSYDANGDLVGVTDPIGGVMSYTYNADGDLLTVVDPRGITVVTNTYDNQDRVNRQVFADGATIQFNYVSETETRVTDERGNTSIYRFNDTGNPIEITDPLGRVTRSTWDANYNRTSATDGRGNTTIYEYDSAGNLTRMTDALGQETTYTYEPTFNQVAIETDPDGHVTTYAYDASGNLTSITDALGNVTTMTYDGRGLLASTTDLLGNTTAFEYDAAGHLTQITDALGQQTAMTYDAVGNLLSLTDAKSDTTQFAYDALNRQTAITDPLGGVTQTAYDANGNRTQITDPLGNSTAFDYDARNRLTQMTNALGHTEGRAYDAKGNLTALTDANGNTTAYTYDAADQLTQETRPGNAIHAYEYDNAGNQTATIDPAGVRIDQNFDAINRLVARQHSSREREIYAYDARGNRTRIERRDAADQMTFGEDTQYDALSRPVRITSALGQVTTFDYDANGNQTGTTDPLGRVTSQSFDALNRVIQIIDAASGLTGFDYDAVGNLTGVTDPRSLATTYTYDALDREVALDSPDTGLAQSTYDANGNLIGRTDSRGIAVAHTYDALDRRTATQYPDSTEDRAFRYDERTNGRGRWSGYDDQSGSVDFTYDARGNLIGESRTVQNQGYAMGYGYDGADRVTRIDYPSGLQVTYAHDGQGRIDSINSDVGPILDDITYLPFGPVDSWSDGSGAQRTLTYDANYRLTSISVPGLLEWRYSHDDANNIIALADDLDAGRNQTFVYDALDRLADAAGGYGTYQFTFDPVGNRLTEDDDGQLTQYAYGGDSNRLLSATGADADSFTYDEVGNQIADAQFTSIYNQANRFVEVQQGGIAVAQYLYNAEGQRVAKTVGATAKHFVYGQEGQLLGVYDGSDGSVIEEIVYLGNTPVATVRGGQVYFVHTDHLGTPRVVSDSTQQIIWRWDSDPFGEAVAGEDPDGDSVAFVFGLRFPGQWFDAETGQHYNHFRDYVPTAGRYIESDPIGLEGGFNTYLYAHHNPINNIDHDGQSTLVLQQGWKLIFVPLPGARVAGGIIIVVGGTILLNEVYQNVRSRGKSDPISGKKPINPGRNRDGKCKPCPPDEFWEAPGSAHGSTCGTHWHGIVWNQDPATCMCFPKRVSGPSRDNLR